MKVRKNNFIWLFAFADLAFLLLISFTQISDARLQKISLPKVPQENGQNLITDPALHFKLFVSQAGSKDLSNSSETRTLTPFQLVTFQGKSKIDESPLLSESQLLEKLKDIYMPDQPGPVLWPHPLASSEDLLTAYVLISKVWRNQDVVIAVRPEDKGQGQVP